MKIINLSAHVSRLVLKADGENILECIEFEGTDTNGRKEVRVGEVQVGTKVMQQDGYELSIQQYKFGEVQNLPDPEPNTLFIVSAMVISALREQGIRRTDLISPRTDKTAIRKNGQVIGVFGYRQQV